MIDFEGPYHRRFLLLPFVNATYTFVGIYQSFVHYFSIIPYYFIYIFAELIFYPLIACHEAIDLMLQIVQLFLFGFYFHFHGDDLFFILEIGLVIAEV